MSRALLALFSENTDYLNRFLTYFRKREEQRIDIVGFTSHIALQKHLEKHEIDLLLVCENDISPEALKSVKTMVCPRADGTKANKNIHAFAYMGDISSPGENPSRIDMYRPMKEIAGDILNIIRRSKPTNDDTEKAADIYGIYILDGQADRNSLAWQVTKKLMTGSRDALYIDTDRFSPIDNCLAREQRYTLSDLIYYYRIGSDRFKDILTKTAFDKDGIWIIPAPVMPDDMEDLSASKWQSFLSAAAAAAGCSVIVIDIAECCRDLITFFDICKNVYLFSESYALASGDSLNADPSSASYTDMRAMAFYEYFRSRGREDIFQKFKNGKDFLSISCRTKSERLRKI